MRFRLIKYNSREWQTVGAVENKGNILLNGDGIELLNFVIGEYIAGGIGRSRDAERSALLVNIES